jgi:superfamily II DNA or RNA helicase
MIRIQKLNETYLKIDSSDTGILYELEDAFSFYADGYKFHPKYKMGVWDGKLKLFSAYKQIIYAGLMSEVVKFCDTRGYEYEFIESSYGMPSQKAEVSPEEIVKFVDSLNIHSDDKKLDIRPYQYEAIYKSIRNFRHTVLSSTGSGKSLIIYSLIRWMMHEYEGSRILIVVPTQQLCRQMQSDFVDYSSHNGFDAIENTHIIMGGIDKNVKKSITVSTWQSLQKDKVSKEWLNSFDAILVDECHGAKSTQLTGIMEKATEVQYRLGFTGTLDNIKTNKLTIQGLFGDVIRVSDTKKLMEAGYLSQLDIKCLVLKHGKETNHLFKTKVEYQKEIDYLISHEKRNKFIRNLALSLKGNTLILFTRVEDHGQKIYDLLSEKANGKPIYFIHGGVDVDDRDNVRSLVENSQDAIIVASSGTFAAGVNIKRLHNLIFAAPTKSMIRVLQSIGRGLRLAHDKNHVTLYDISDRLNASKNWHNHTYDHMKKRLEIYVSEQFEYDIVEIPFGD